METIKNIKVSAHYETDSTPSKFDALFAQYEAAKAIADETKSTKQPLINAMGEEKLKLIYKQLDVIVQRLNMISKCKDAVVGIEASTLTTGHFIRANIRTCYTWKNPDIYLDGNTSPQAYWFKEDGIVTLWNRLGLYELLEEQCESMLEKMIEEQNKKTDRINTNYNNMIND